MDNPISGWGIDRRVEDRPGYPEEQTQDIGHDTLEGQRPWGDTIPLHGLSGVLRRAAYRQPDWKPRRWMTLLLADRVDVVESALRRRRAVLAGSIGALAAGFWFWKRLRRPGRTRR